MPLPMTRLILYVHDVPRLKSFYQTHFDLLVSEEIGAEWVMLKAGAVEIALHRVGKQYRDRPKTDVWSNAKLVFTVESGLTEFRERLIAAGVSMRPLKRFEGYPQLMCDGEDPEGNVFQLAQPD